MIRIERIDFHRPSSDKMEEGIRVTDDELERSIIVDRDFNPIMNAIYGLNRKEIAVTNELAKAVDKNDDNTYIKYEWPEVQEFQEVDGFADNANFDFMNNVWFIKKSWLNANAK